MNQWYYSNWCYGWCGTSLTCGARPSVCFTPVFCIVPELNEHQLYLSEKRSRVLELQPFAFYRYSRRLTVFESGGWVRVICVRASTTTSVQRVKFKCSKRKGWWYMLHRVFCKVKSRPTKYVQRQLFSHLSESKLNRVVSVEIGILHETSKLYDWNVWLFPKINLAHCKIAIKSVRQPPRLFSRKSI